MKAIGRPELGLEENHFLIDNSNKIKFVGMDSDNLNYYCCTILFVIYIYIYISIYICINYVHIKSFDPCQYRSTDYLSRYHAVRKV